MIIKKIFMIVRTQIENDERQNFDERWITISLWDSINKKQRQMASI
jgi:hypothetical protein